MQVGGVFPIMDGEGAVEPDLLGIFAQKPRADGVEGARPCQSIGQEPGLFGQHVRRNALDPAAHLGCGPARKRQQHHAARIGALHDQMRHAMGERVGLARAGASDDQ